MTEINTTQLVDEIVPALDSPEKCKTWVQKRFDDGDVDGDVLSDSYRELTRRLFTVDGFQIAHWENLLFTTAAHSTNRDGLRALEACRAAIVESHQLIQQDTSSGVSADRAISLASALTLVRTVQRRLRQPIDETLGTLCKQFSDSFNDMAELCQSIWKRHGQVSGEDGPFVWDMRNNQWRLSQDFKAYRPES